MEPTVTKTFIKRFKAQQEQKTQMSFIDHLEVLRWHIVRAAIAIVSATVLVFIFVDWVFDNIIYAPASPDFVTYGGLCSLGHKLHLGDALCMPPVRIPLLGSTVSGPFMSAISISFTCGIILAFPYVFWEIWRYIKPALSPKELKNSRGSIVWVSICFFSGAAFGYYLLAPFTFNFLGNYKLGNLGVYTYMPTLDDYIETLTSIILGCGIGFELPVLAYVLSKIGIVTPKMLKTYRKYAYVLILILAAVITPSPDWTSQTIVTIPLVILYEISIFLSSRVAKEKLRKENL
ncbi:MAG: twin-arginine translocase subunit TatC [Bacteroidota bacterium]|nr:twin-arginine translocase subunit TatC [Bacteroidota bacterium]